MITEDEAKQKWCPFTFSIPDQRGPDGSGIREGGPWPCCTTSCMGWVVDPRTTTEARRKGSDGPWEAWAWNPREHTKDPRQKQVLAEYEFRDAVPVGYCGAIGHHSL